MFNPCLDYACGSETVREVLERLPFQALAIALFRVEGHSCAEIAAALGLTAEGVHYWLNEISLTFLDVLPPEQEHLLRNRPRTRCSERYQGN